MKFPPAVWNASGSMSRGACAFALALTLGGLTFARPQEQQSQDQQAPPITSPQDGNRPPISRDRVPRNSPNSRNDQNIPAPPLLTIPGGTVLLVRINEPLSSDRNQVGDQFTGVLEQPLVINGWVVARRGQVVVGQVKSVQKAGRVKGVLTWESS